MTTAANTTTLAPGTWSIDPTHSTVGFVARHLMISKVRGTFDTFAGTISVGQNLEDSTVEVSIELGSVNTGDPNRDGHLKGADFFNVEGGAQMTFRSTAITARGSEGTMTGDLTIRGITKPVTLDVSFEGVATDPWGNTKGAFTATGEINRKDWGIEWNAPLEAGGVLVGDKVKLELDIQAVKA
jgi:polyisoprenoid-binding protein YceI